MSSVPAQGFNVAVPLPFQTVTIAGNSGSVGNNQGLSLGATLTVSAASGTLPVLNVALQTSQDNGATWTDLWHFEPLGAPGSAILPPLSVVGFHRYSWTLSGTLPSFTFEVTETGSGQDAPLVRRFFDYTAGLLAGTLNAASATFDVTGARAVTATLTIGTAVAAASYAIDFSADGANWFTPSTPVAAIANSTVQVTATAGVVARFARVRCSTGGTTQIGTVASLTAV